MTGKPRLRLSHGTGPRGCAEAGQGLPPKNLAGSVVKTLAINCFSEAPLQRPAERGPYEVLEDFWSVGSVFGEFAQGRSSEPRLLLVPFITGICRRVYRRSS